MQYKNPQVVGLVAHLLIKVVSLPATVKHWLLSLPFVGLARVGSASVPG